MVTLKDLNVEIVRPLEHNCPKVEVYGVSGICYYSTGEDCPYAKKIENKPRPKCTKSKLTKITEEIT